MAFGVQFLAQFACPLVQCVLRGDHPCHLAIWGKTGTGKTLTLSYFLNLLTELAKAKGVQVRHEHLDLSTPQPCFRALNSLACLFKASKRHRKGISLEELMVNISGCGIAFHCSEQLAAGTPLKVNVILKPANIQ